MAGFVDDDAVRERLIRFYEKYDAEKLGDVDVLVQKVSGKAEREKKLFNKLIGKYGPEPVTEAMIEEQRAAKKKEKQQRKDAAIAKASEAEVKDLTFRQRLERFYQKYQPEKQGDIDKLIEKTKGDASRETKLMDMLIGKYGEEPGASEKLDEEADNDNVDAMAENYFRERLTRFYSKYQPEKLGDVEKLIEKAGGDQSQIDRLFTMLVKKYGPEPNEEDDEDNAADEVEDEQESSEEEESSNFRKIKYCPVDGMPAEYCEYIESSFHDCLPWLLDNYPDLILTTKKGVTVTDYCSALEAGNSGVLDRSSTNTKRSGKAGPNAAVSKGKKGKKAKAEPVIVIDRLKRNKKKFITAIQGIDTFDIKPKEAAKKLGKKFASGVSVTKATSNPNAVQIEIQGDCFYEAAEHLVALFPEITKDKVFVMDNGEKIPAFS